MSRVVLGDGGLVCATKSHVDNFASGGAPANGYVAEDGTTHYVAEDNTTFYVQEH